ncbi:MAG: elongation factor Ts [Firmicutes bacterium]|nr:elongation factor Ts [Bacillota bacterium]
MAVTAALIKELRERTGVGMSACKNALVETDGNIDEAIEFLRKQGLANAAKKAGRIAAEGLSYAYITDDNSVAVVLEVNSETDFVAKNEKFRTFVEDVAKQIIKNGSSDVDALLASSWDGQADTVQDALNEMISVIGEKLSIRRFEVFKNDGSSKLVSYIHAGGKIAVVVDFKTSSNDAKVVECGKNVAMQIAAMNPRYVTEDQVPQSVIDHEKEVLMEQAKNDPKNAGKPDNIIEKMLAGRLKKEMKEFCLVDQEYVQGDKISVKQYVDSVAKEIGAELEIKSFVRFETGEGIEKKEENFAEEVAKTMGQ